MSYEHTTVKRIERATEATLKSMAERISTQSAEMQEVLAQTTKLVDGIRVTNNCAQFAEGMRKVHRNVQFGITKHCKTEWKGGIVVVTSLWAYLPGHDYAMCHFGYSDVGVNGTDYRWFVASRTIRNEKYADHRDQYSMVTSDKFERIMTAVKKHVRPYSPMESAQVTYDAFADKIRNKNWTVRESYSNARGTVLNTDDLRDELFGMLLRGYEFNNPTLKEKIIVWQDKHNEMVEQMNKAVHCYYVQTRMLGDEQIFEVLEVFDVKSNNLKGSQQQPQVFKADDLPEDIAGKMAALSMLEKGGYVEGLGMKATDTTYWVERT